MSDTKNEMQYANTLKLRNALIDLHYLLKQANNECNSDESNCNVCPFNNPFVLIGDSKSAGLLDSAGYDATFCELVNKLYVVLCWDEDNDYNSEHSILKKSLKHERAETYMEMLFRMKKHWLRHHDNEGNWKD